MTYNSNTWVNRTGINTQPGTDNNWDLVASVNQTVNVNGNPFEFIKKPTNPTQSVLQTGDMVVDGWWDASEFWPKAIYLGGDVNTKTNWQPISPITSIP